MHNDFYTSDELAYLDDIVEAFVETQLQIIHRETLLDKYNTTQGQSLVLLEDGGVNEIIRQTESSISITNKTPHQALLETYNQDKLALIMQGLGVTGSLLPAAFSLPSASTDLSSASAKHNKRKSTSSYWKSKLITSVKRDELTFAAFRYPKTVDIHHLRSIAIRLLVNLCPYTNNN
ncbi:hypothetical protein V8B55DRAFT_1452728 [Mucor lusitanicus]|uniref:Uncharacterized protein n=2 Tax=Mucor circinelloides f. lusitanicus TaxID=29924 RepID=A0A168GVH8_MUCCL|nr:hypothetical protein MUCCIDRAFT_115584 [Mucor lusitanicus CBS 277.49]